MVLLEQDLEVSIKWVIVSILETGQRGDVVDRSDGVLKNSMYKGIVFLL